MNASVWNNSRDCEVAESTTAINMNYGSNQPRI